jgi:branched-chain amino acid transport system ATP-binding protein
LLRLEELSTFYGNFEAVRAVSLRVDRGELVGIIGANGAGKSTVLRTICGLVRRGSGAIFLDGEDISALSTEARVARGLVYCPEDRKLFRDMTVLENLEMGAYARPEGFRSNLARVFALFPVLAERRHVAAGALSGGQQQMLAIGRTLMSGPRLVLFDEPSTGLAPIIAEQLMDVIGQLNRNGMTAILVEQNVNLALDIVGRSYVLENGRVVLEGASGALRADERVKQSYLGG